MTIANPETPQDLIAGPRGLPEADYDGVLRDYLLSGSEDALYRASLMSRDLVDRRVGPDDLIALHAESVERVMQTLPPLDRVRAFPGANQFLLEVMIGYGVHHRQYLDLAEQSDRDKRRAIDFIAHELRTPLTSARGYIDLASRSVLGGQLQIVPDYLAQARESLVRLGRLSTMLVAASRGETPDLERTLQDLRALTRQSVEWSLLVAAENGLTLLFEGVPTASAAFGDAADPADPGGAAPPALPSLPPVPVLANADALLSAIGNLLTNACRYTPAGGAVRVTCRADEDHATVEVTDNGNGMTEEIQGRIFERFYRAPEARASGHDGMGLGLFLTRELVKASGGTIEVESEPGHGSTFTICLPIYRHAATAT